MAFLATYFLGRLLFSFGYTRAGPQGRLVGAIVMDLVILGQLALSIASVSKLIQA